MLNIFIATIADDVDIKLVIKAITERGFRIIEKVLEARYVVVEGDKKLSELAAIPGVEDAEKEKDITTPEEDRKTSFKNK